MAGEAPKRSWNDAFGNVGGQGMQFEKPISASGMYFAFLSKEDLDGSQDPAAYDILFEVAPWEWVQNVILQPPLNIAAMAPNSPASLFHISAVAPSTILATLGLKTSDDLAEGSWYILNLISGEGDVNGDLYDPDIDKAKDPSGLDYGTYHIVSAQIISLPQVTDGGVNSGGKPPGETPEQTKTLGPIRDRLAARFYVYGKPENVTPPTGRRSGFEREAATAAPAITTPVSSVGIMDVGQGNCNMLIVGVDPILYYDLGYPLFFYANSAPPTLQPNSGAYTGPIPQNRNADLKVILSHWDWDHWRLGAIANLVNIRWCIPQQPVGPSAANFINSLTNRVVWPNGLGTYQAQYYDIYRCTPPNGAAAAMIINNSGLALIVIANLPVADATTHDIVLTGDANFDTLGLNYAGLTGITAVHHGSESHGADQNLPPQAANYNNAGAVVYSYGVYNSRSGVQRHAYGFPRQNATVNYTAAGWTVATSTAEGPNINTNPPSVGDRGNVRVGDQTALNATYNGTAFFAFPNAIQ